jgi:hypothetical protein
MAGIPCAVPVTWRSERSKTLDWRSGLGRSVRTSRFFGYRDFRTSVRVSVKDALLGLFGYRPRQLCSKCERRLSLSNAGLGDLLTDQRCPQRLQQQQPPPLVSKLGHRAVLSFICYEERTLRNASLISCLYCLNFCGSWLCAWLH